jgi:hypothetical protein
MFHTSGNMELSEFGHNGKPRRKKMGSALVLRDGEDSE